MLSTNFFLLGSDGRIR